MNNKLIIGIVVALVLIGVGAWMLWGGGSIGGGQEVSMDEPVDIVLDFYRPWFEALQSPDTDPYEAGLASAALLGSELRERLKDAKGQSEVDPVLCQSSVPSKILTRVVYENENGAQILVTAPQKESTEQALVTLTRLNDGWYISDISCSPGEFAPDREFSFEREGHLLKSVPEPLNSDYWHLVYEENGQPGHVAPLFFDSQSMCTTPDGNTSVCNPDNFIEPSKAFVQGQLTETGVEVSRVELRE